MFDGSALHFVCFISLQPGALMFDISFDRTYKSALKTNANAAPV